MKEAANVRALLETVIAVTVVGALVWVFMQFMDDRDGGRRIQPSQNRSASEPAPTPAPTVSEAETSDRGDSQAAGEEVCTQWEGLGNREPGYTQRCVYSVDNEGQGKYELVLSGDYGADALLVTVTLLMKLEEFDLAGQAQGRSVTIRLPDMPAGPDQKWNFTAYITDLRACMTRSGETEKRLCIIGLLTVRRSEDNQADARKVPRRINGDRRSSETTEYVSYVRTGSDDYDVAVFAAREVERMTGVQIRVTMEGKGIRFSARGSNAATRRAVKGARDAYEAASRRQ